MTFLLFICQKLLLILAIYLIFAMISFIMTALKLRKSKAYNIRYKYGEAPYNNNIIVLVYAHNNEKTIVPMLEAFNKQTYPKNNYQLHIILDNCTDNSSNILEFIGGAKIWRVGDNATMGKDEAITWTLERLLSFQNANAFVFLNADRIIDENFLSNVNMGLFQDDIIIGSTNIICEDNTFKNKLTTIYNNYKENFIKFGRTLRGLTSLIDSDMVVIKQEVIEKVKCVDFKDTNAELKYTTLLAKNNLICKYNPNIKTSVNINDYQQKQPSTKFKYSIFASCLKILYPFNYKFTEHVFHLINPPVLAMLIIFVAVNMFAHSFVLFHNDLIFIRIFNILGACSVIAFLYACKKIKLSFKDMLILACIPFKNLVLASMQIPFISKLNFKNKEEKVTNIEKMTIDVDVITTGRTNLKCQMELISEDGMAKAVFIFKKKKYSSSSHIRMFDAIKEIIDKLEENGFRLKICQVCGYFASKLDGSINLVKGTCHKCIANNESTEEQETLLWKTCDDYIPKEINKVIDISTYM